MKKEKGTLVHWNDGKGYGFIRPHNGNEDIFLHVKSLPHYQRRPKKDDVVIYKADVDKKQKPYARYAKIKGIAWSPFTIFWINSILLFGIYIYFAFQEAIPFHPLAIYVGMSLITIRAYSRDKSAAQSGAWRTPEFRLHLFEMLGGWPGALLAQLYYRHKSRKISYQIFFWMIVILHSVFWYHFLTHQEMYRPYIEVITEKLSPFINQARVVIISVIENIR